MGCQKCQFCKLCDIETGSQITQTYGTNDQKMEDFRPIKTLLPWTKLMEYFYVVEMSHNKLRCKLCHLNQIQTTICT